jgi:hypothetical protein
VVQLAKRQCRIPEREALQPDILAHPREDVLEKRKIGLAGKPLKDDPGKILLLTLIHELLYDRLVLRDGRTQHRVEDLEVAATPTQPPLTNGLP